MRYFILSMLIVMSFALCSEAEEVIKELSGSETITVGPLTVPDNWEIQWETKGQYLQILLNTSDNVPLDYAVQQMGPGEGVSKQTKGGSYIIDLNAQGAWKVRIVKSE